MQPMSDSQQGSFDDSSPLNTQEESEFDQFQIFEEEEKDWREIIKNSDNLPNSFHSNSIQKIMVEANNSKKEKTRKPRIISESKLSLKAYYHLLKMWFMKQVAKCAKRMYNLDKEKQHNIGKLLSLVKFENVLKLIEARGKTLDIIFETINRVLTDTRLKGLPNLMERTMYLLNFCGLETRLLTLVSFENFNLFEKFKIRNQGKPRRRGSKKNVGKLKEYVRWVADESQNQNSNHGQQQFDDLEKYSFTQTMHSSHFIEKPQTKSAKKYTYGLKQLQNYFLRPFQWLQVYSQKSKAWKTFNIDTFNFMVDDDVKRKIEGMATVFIYSAKIMNIKQQFKHLFQKRPFKTIQIMDQTVRFSDGLVKIKKRRAGLQIRKVHEKIMKYSQYNGPNKLLSQLEVTSRKQSFKLIQKIVTQNYFPKSLFQFHVSDYVIVPSQVPKFQHLPLDAEPIEGLEFEGQKVYSRKLLTHLHSSNGWIDVGRMVKEQEYAKPVKETLNKMGKQLRLYSHEQTVPFKWVLQDNKFIRNQFDNVYINSFTLPPEGVCIIEQNVTHVCKKAGFQFSKVIQGFKDGRPNLIGTAIFIKDKEKILQLQRQRVIYLEEKKAKSKRNSFLMIWKKIFKAIRVSHQLKERYQVKV